MNKKRISLTILLTVAVITCFVGCGKKEPGTIISEKEIDISELIAENETNEDEAALDETQEEESGEHVISFECMDEIREADPASGLVQIDDMIFQYGCKVSEAIEIIENSQSSFEYYNDYNEDELVTPNGIPVLITLLKGNDHYFGLLAENMADETITLKDCTVTRIEAYKASKGNVFCAGFDDKNSNIITYDYIKDLMGDYEIIKEFTESESSNNLDIRQISLVYLVPFEISPDGNLRIEYVFASDTGELKTFKISD